MRALRIQWGDISRTFTSITSAQRYARKQLAEMHTKLARIRTVEQNLVRHIDLFESFLCGKIQAVRPH